MKEVIVHEMQLNRTYFTFDDVLEYILPISIFKIYRVIKKAYTTSKLFANLIIIAIFTVLFQEENKASDLYRRVWKKRSSNKESKDVDETIGCIRPFRINIPDSILEDLKLRLERTRYGTSPKNSNSNQEFNYAYLRKVTDYWKNKFDWRKYERDLNKFPQFTTKIGNIDLHFLYCKGNQQQNSRIKLIPLLLIHNWPGSFADFHKVIPILQTSCVEYGFAFDIVCPSLPGCGFSGAPLQTEFSALNCSEILLALMDCLGYTEFYVHGYGWGAITASLMARYNPYRVKGLHVNMCFALPYLFDSFIRTLLVSVCPYFINSAEYSIIFPLKKRMRMLLQETGLLHMQWSKPDTLGSAINDSPTTLAIHVLERFHFKKNSDNSQLQDGELTGKLLDDVLALITVLWVSNDFTNGARLYKKSISDVLKRTHEKGLPLTVPCGIVFFPEEIFMLPKYMMENITEDLVSYTVMPRGGHLAAMEEPLLLAKDIGKFVQLVEKRSATK